MYGRGVHTGTGFAHNNLLPWEERQTKPVFRGHPRIRMLDRTEWEVHPEKCPSHVKEMGHRPKAADFSMDHPDLLDAAVSLRAAVSSFNTPCLKNNATEGLDRIFGIKIPQDQYYGKYQTVVVLGGIGAAFRVGRHLSAGQAMILQKFRFEEWFVPYMEPYVHYIPLKEDLSDIKEVMEWVRDHPSEVKKIAEQGEAFYWEFMAYKPTENHWHELFWRLSLAIHKMGDDRLKYGKGRAIWIYGVPKAYERDRSGPGWKEVEMKEDLEKEDAAMARLSGDLMWLPGLWQGAIAINKDGSRPSAKSDTNQSKPSN